MLQDQQEGQVEYYLHETFGACKMRLNYNSTIKNPEDIEYIYLTNMFRKIAQR